MGSAEFIKYCNSKGHWCPLALVPKRIFKIFPPEPALDGVSREGIWTAAWRSLLDLPLQIRCLLLPHPVFYCRVSRCPRRASSPCCRGQGGHSSGRFPHVSMGQRSLCALSSRGDTASGALSPPASHHTHPPGERRSGGKWGRALPGFRVQPGVWDKNPPPKKSRQKIHYPPARGCVSARPRPGTGTGFEQVLQCGVPWAFGGPYWGGSKWDPSFQSWSPGAAAAVTPRNCTFILFTYSP